MKKFFTLAAVLGMAIAANAETVESWSIHEGGVLRPEYVANPDPAAMSVVAFSTANVEGTHTSGPIAGYTDAPTIPLEPKVDNTWKAISSVNLMNDGSSVYYYVQGKGNPVDLTKITWDSINPADPNTNFRANWNASYYQPDGSAGLPKNGTYITVSSKVDGLMKVAVFINKGKRDIYVAKASDKKALLFPTEVIASGYENGKSNAEGTGREFFPEFPMQGTEGTAAFVVSTGNQNIWGYLNFEAKKDETYYIFNKNTQIGFGGFEFTPGGKLTNLNSIIADENVEAPIYNIMGQRVDASYKGLVIKNGKKYIAR